MHPAGDPPTLVLSKTAPSCVRIAVKDLAHDFQEITGYTLEIVSNLPDKGTAIVIGIAGESDPIKSLTPRCEAELASLRKKWETFLIYPINKDVLLVAGSDARGTMYGVYELSERLLGTDPLKHWTGYVPDPLEQVSWKDGIVKEGPPTFQYRGFFLNDEDSLLAWKKVNREVEPEVYEEILETICRLKGNMIAPAMYANYMSPESQQLVHDRGLYYTASHLEILLTNPSVGYWDRFVQKQYGKALPYSFVRHPEEMEAFWRDSIKRHQPHRAVWPIGLRGFDDRDFVETDPNAPKTIEERAALTGESIAVQKRVLEEVLGPTTAPPCTLTMRGEVYDQYKTGKMNLPEETILIWQDAGSTATFPTLPQGEEQNRAGGNGVYYHLSYCDNQWVQWVSPALIQQEFSKIIDAGATRYVLYNVGDMREIPLSMAAGMALAWNSDNWIKNSGEARAFLVAWCTQQFSPSLANEIANVYEAYWKLEYPGRVTSVVEAVAPSVTTDLISPFWEATSAIDYAELHGGASSLENYAASRNFNHPSPRYGNVTPDRLTAIQPQWDQLYAEAMALYERLPENRRPFFFDNVILQLQTSRLVNAWATGIIDGFNHSKKLEFAAAQSRFTEAAEALDILIEERAKACHGKWVNWFRGEYHNGWEHSLWSLKPEGLVRDTRTLVRLANEAEQ